MVHKTLTQLRNEFDMARAERLQAMVNFKLNKTKQNIVLFNTARDKQVECLNAVQNYKSIIV